MMERKTSDQRRLPNHLPIPPQPLCPSAQRQCLHRPTAQRLNHHNKITNLRRHGALIRVGSRRVQLKRATPPIMRVREAEHSASPKWRAMTDSRPGLFATAAPARDVVGPPSLVVVSPGLLPRRTYPHKQMIKVTVPGSSGTESTAETAGEN